MLCCEATNIANITDESTLQFKNVLSFFRFTLYSANLDNSPEESSTFVLNNVAWKIRLSNNDSIVFVDLESSSNDDYNVEAWATMKMLPNSNHESVLLGHMPTRLFNKNNTRKQFRFGPVREISRLYWNNTHATLELEIATKLSNKTEQTDPIEGDADGRIHVMVAGATKLGEVASREVVVHGIRWVGVVERNGEYLSVYLKALDEDMGMCVYRKVTATFKLLPANNNPGIKPIVVKGNVYNICAGPLGVVQFAKWSDFIKYYVFEEKANVLIQFKVSEPRSVTEV